MRELWRRVEMLCWRRSLDRDLEEELQFHLEMKTRETGDRTAARRALGNPLLLRERARDTWGWRWLDDVLWDVRYALRQFRQHPGFTAVAITMLALGIGVNTAVFTVTSAALFNGYRLVDRNDRIVYLDTQRNGQYSAVSYPDFEDWRAQARSFDGMGAVGAEFWIALKDASGFAESYIATRLSANAFRVLGCAPILGRDFAPSDERPGATPVAILSYDFWERRYGKDPRIVGQTLHIDEGVPTTVIGVMPEGFSFPENQALWVPFAPTPDLQRRDARLGLLWFVFGRLSNGATIESARAEMQTIGNQLASAYPSTNQGVVPQLKRFTEYQVGTNARNIYGAMWGAVGVVLLIACANLAHLLLARAIGRTRELSLRITLGAGRWRIMRQLLIESLVLSAIGGLGGWGIARWGVRVYARAANPGVEQWNHNLLDIAMDGRVLGYLMAISIGTGVLVGLAPALRLSTLDLHAVLKDGGWGATVGRAASRFSRLLVVGEVSLAVVLLAGAGVLIRSFLNMATADLGVRTAHTVTMLVRLPDERYPGRDGQMAFFDRLKTRVAAIPGVDSVSMANALPGAGLGRRSYEIAGEDPADEQRRPAAPAVAIAPDYFRTLGATMLAGRDFRDADGVSGVPVVVVNQRFASRHWPGEDPVGKRLRLFPDGKSPDAWLTVIGVASNIVQNDLNRTYEPLPLLYVLYGPRPIGMWLFVHSPLPLSGLVAAFRREMNALDPMLAIQEGPYRLADRIAADKFYTDTRNQAVLYLIFGAIALTLASSGLYAVMAHSVGQRTQEMGVRLALGATSHDILALVAAQGLRPAGVGLAIGLIAALGLTPILRSQLVHVSPTDPITLLVAVAVLMAAAMLGCWVPARRAMRVDPVVALRHE